MRIVHPQTSPDSAACCSRQESEQGPAIPDYLQEVYWWAYLHPRSIRIFERQWIVNLILWGNFKTLRDNAVNQFGANISGRTLQVACVYGDFTGEISRRLGPGARLDVVDVAPIQLENLQRKLGHHSQVFLALQDSSSLAFAQDTFDHVVVFFLLHELPIHYRKRTIAEVLRVLKPGGKAVFVDYHRPVGFHPHRYLMWPVLKMLEPFALDLWRSEIVDLITDDDLVEAIQKTTYFGGLYQQVVMVGR